MKVLLIREPAKPNREFPDEPDSRAWQRADSLAQLHGCDFNLVDGVIHVDARDWYNKD